MSNGNCGGFSYIDSPSLVVKGEKSSSSVDGELESSHEKSSSESGFEMPPEFPPGATVGDLSSYVSNVINGAELKSKPILGVGELDFHDSSEFTEFNSPVCTNRYCPIRTNDQNIFSIDTQNGQILYHSTTLHPSSESSAVAAKILPPFLDAPLNVNTCRKCDQSSRSGKLINVEKSDHELNGNVDKSPVPVDGASLRDPEIHSNCSSNDFDDDFDDFGTFQAAEELETVIKEAPSFHHPEDFEVENGGEFDFADFKDFTSPPSSEHQQLLPPASSLVKSLLAHTETALETAFSTDREAGIITYFPSEFPNFAASRTQLRELWSCSSSETVKNVAVHPESFNCAHVWNTSLTNSMYLETIGVDIQNTRLFPPNNGRFQLLEPTPIERVAHSPPANSAPSVILSPAPKKPASEFEWSTGETTELPSAPEAVVMPMSNADLDFFEEMSSKPAAKKSTQVSDLEAEFLTSFVLPPPPPPPETVAVVPTLSLPSLNPQRVNEAQALQDFQPFLAFPTSQLKNE